MRRLIISLVIIILAVGCQSKEEDKNKKVFVTCSIADQQAKKCTRFMDRTIYLSYSIGTNPDKNNEFQKLAVKEVLQDISESTNLGVGYWSFKEIDPSLIDPLTEISYGSEFRSFIQIYPDAEFNNLAENFGFLPDQNAITVLNAANKRQFYIIIRASCFNPNEIACTNDPGAVMGGDGLKALVARQLGFLIGMSSNCSNPDRTMCPDYPRDTQWSTSEKSYFFGSFNNALETISLNPEFYEEHFLD